MTDNFLTDTGVDEIVNIVILAGGKFVGRTRLQKTVYLLKICGFFGNFEFEYRHYGPYSEELSNVADLAVIFDYLNEEKKQASWGGIYSIYHTDRELNQPECGEKKKLIDLLSRVNPIELELAATAVYFAKEGIEDPWKETEDRKPDKAEGNRLSGAKKLYSSIRELDLPKPLPEI